MTSFLKPSCLAHPISEKLDMIGFLYITIFILLVVIANNDHKIYNINKKSPEQTYRLLKRFDKLTFLQLERKYTIGMTGFEPATPSTPC